MPLQIDGRLSEPAWSAAPWSDPFVDIDGTRRPPLATRVKMLWDDEFLYFGADLEEPQLWATLDERDSVIFQDNDFEIFIDPDGDTHAYFEIEINALNTVWDLLLIQPYRDGGPAIHAWDIAGLRTAVNLRGTINRPEDRDEGWSIEVAIPWKILAEAAPRRARPRAGDQWRVNFSRVQWQLDVGMVDSPSGSIPGQASRCLRTTGSGVLRGRSTCTCPSGGVWSSFRTGPPANPPRPLSKTATTGSNGRCGASTTANANTARPTGGTPRSHAVECRRHSRRGARLQAGRAGDGVAVRAAGRRLRWRSGAPPGGWTRTWSRARSRKRSVKGLVRRSGVDEHS